MTISSSPSFMIASGAIIMPPPKERLLAIATSAMRASIGADPSTAMATSWKR